MSGTHCLIYFFSPESNNALYKKFLKEGVNSIQQDLTEYIYKVLTLLPSPIITKTTEAGIIASYELTKFEDVAQIGTALTHLGVEKMIMHMYDGNEYKDYLWFDGKDFNLLYRIGHIAPVDSYIKEHNYDVDALKFICDRFNSKAGKITPDLSLLKDSSIKSFWMTSDKEWMKKRRESWKLIKRKIDKLYFLEKEEKKALKNYYLTGEEDKEWKLYNMSGGVLLELWLHPDKSEEHWETVKEKDRVHPNRFKYASYREFIDINSHLDGYCIDDELSFFDGLEERLCQHFHFDRIRREDWAELTDEVFFKKAKDGLNIAASINNYLQEENPNPFNITRYKVQAWFDAIKIAYNPKHKYPHLEYMISSLCAVLKRLESHHELVVNMANEIELVINDPEFPKEAKEVINKFKKNFGCPE